MLKNFLAAILTLAAVSCSSDDPVEIGGTVPPPPGKEDVVREPKPKAMWFGGAVNFPVLSSQERVDKYLRQIKATGIDILYMDVMGPNNRALCNVETLKPYEEMTYDIFEYVLTKCDELDMQIIASLTPLCVGNPRTKAGPALDSDRWDGKTQYRKVTKDGDIELIDIKDDATADAVMLEPSIPEVRQYCVDLCSEVVRNYSHHKSFRGLSLDYVRYSNGTDNASWFGYGDTFVKNFEARMGVSIKDQNDFITPDGGLGDFFKEWVYFRTLSISEVIRAISKAVKAVDPECEVHLWASADWDSRYSVGQNWASTSYDPYNDPAANDPNHSRYIDKYHETGFAEALDVFSLGAYSTAVWISENPGSIWSVENFVTTYQKYIPKNHSCKVWGSIASYAYPTSPDKLSDAITLCLKHTDGMSVFEFYHVNTMTQWSLIKKGITNSGY